MISRSITGAHSLDCNEVIATLRQDRGGLVSTLAEYAFVHAACLSYARKCGKVVTIASSRGEF